MVLDAHWNTSAMVDLKDVAPPQFQAPPGFPITAKPSRLDAGRFGATFSTTSDGVRLPLWATTLQDTCADMVALRFPLISLLQSTLLQGAPTPWCAA